MDRCHKNHSRHWLHRTRARPGSLKTRLIVAIGVVLFAVWLAATVFTKFAAFDRSRDFLKTHAAQLALTVLDLAGNDPGQLSQSPGERPYSFVLTRNGKQVVATDGRITDHLATFAGADGEQISKVDGHNWIIATRCDGQNCAVAGIRDTERKYAIRWFVVFVFLPLLAVLMLAIPGIIFAVRIGMRPLDKLAHDVGNLDLNKLDKLPQQTRVKELDPLIGAIETLTEKMVNQLSRERTFLNACAHEIRTPVAGLISQVQALESTKSAKRDDGLQNQLRLIERSGKRTARIANQFLGLAKSSNSLSNRSNIQQFDLCELIRITIADLMMHGYEAHIEMQDEETVWVEADSFSIELIVQNLIENALRHARGDKPLVVRVTCIQQDGCALLRVEDNGPGVPATLISSITERFFRAETSQRAPGMPAALAASAQGAGLGLSIVKDIVDAYQGDLGFSSSDKLGGLSATVRLAILATCKISEAEQSLTSHIAR